MKTTKYTMEISLQDVVITSLFITKKEYTAQLKKLNNLFTAIRPDIKDESGLDRYEGISDRPKHTETWTRFVGGCSDITLVKYECKPGFQFK